MSIDASMLGQLALTHALIMGAVTYLALTQPGDTSKAEIAFLVMGWLIPVLGPILAGLLVMLSKRRRAGSP